MTFDVDLFVLGAGSGGVRAARVAASLGARVAVCEERFLGGTCVNVGCVPKKLMVFGAHFRDELRDAEGFGWNVGEVGADWSRLIANKDREIARLNGVYQKLLESRGVRILRGRGSIVAPNRVRVLGPDGNATELTAKYILIATGSKANRLDCPGAEHSLISDDMFTLPEAPKHAVIVGGGFIAVEFAGILAGYGANVTLLHRGSLFLRGFDRDVRVHLDQEMRRRGIDLRFRSSPASIEKNPNGEKSVTLDDRTVLETNLVLAAIGRTPNSQGLGADEVGIRLSPRGAVLVDERFRTSIPNIYAVGDVIDRVQLTPVALAEGMLVAHQLFGGPPRQVEYDNIPSAVFSNPPIGSVGLSEAEAREAYAHVDVYTSRFTPMKNTMTGMHEKTLMKLLVDRDTDRVVGLHMVGPDAGEIVQGFAVALQCGATKAQFDRTIGIHPTAAEEFVTMREKCDEPDHTLTVDHEDRPRPKIVHHRFDHD